MAADSRRAEKMRLVVVGPGGVGKSAITLSFVRDLFLEEYDPTIEDSYSKTLEMDDGALVELDITDTAGQEEFRGLWGDKHIAAGDGFLVVFSVTDAQSLEDLSAFMKQILRVKDTGKVPVVVCANKVDLEHLREVTKDEGEAFALKTGAVYIETSAKTSFNVEKAYTTLVSEVQQHRKEMASQPAPPVEESKGKRKKQAKKDAAEGKEKGKQKKRSCTIL